jgi:peptidoglycan/LPS O-acetylase OafA/YrhL
MKPDTTPQSFWSRYKSVINFRKDLKGIYIRPDSRYATLDGARAITILLMVLFHVMFGIVMLFHHNYEKIDNFIFNFPHGLRWMWQVQGSDPLFVMCGLLDAYTLYREYRNTQSIQVMRFYKRRLMRILPLFFVALLLYLPTDKDNIGFLWSNLLFASTFVEGHRHIIPVAWSLDVQLQFYFLLPFFVYLMYATRAPVTTIVVLIVASLAWRYWVVASDPEIYTRPFYDIIYDSDYGNLLANKLYYGLDVRIGGFFMGMLVAYLHLTYGKQLKAFFSRHMAINFSLVIGAIAMIALALCLPVEDRTSWYYDYFSPSFNILWLSFDRYLYSLGLSLLVLMALCPVGIGRWVNWLMSWPIWHPVAQLIYPIYLFHFIFIVVAAVLTFWTVDRESIQVVHTYQVFLVFFWTVVLTMAFSTFAHIFIEKPFLVLREKVPTRAPAPAPSPATM